MNMIDIVGFCRGFGHAKKLFYKGDFDGFCVEFGEFAI